jgi:hypothetical protein
MLKNELLDCMYEVYTQTLMEAIQSANFVWIPADEATQFVVMC